MDYTRLSPRARWLFHLQAFWSLLVFWGPLSLVLGAVVSWLQLGQVDSVGQLVSSGLYGTLTTLTVLFFAFVAAIWLPALSFSRWGYRVDDVELLITHGVLVRRVVAIPTQRIQHVDTRQGPLEQWLGLTRLQIYTASGMGADGAIPGLTREEAERLRDLLVRLGGDDGV